MWDSFCGLKVPYNLLSSYWEKKKKIKVSTATVLVCYGAPVTPDNFQEMPHILALLFLTHICNYLDWHLATLDVKINF